MALSREDRLKAKGAPPPPLPLLPLRRHPAQPDTVVWAAGRFIFVYDSQASDGKPRRWEAHTDCIRTLDAAVTAPGTSDSFWVSSGDDKHVIVWEDKGNCWEVRARFVHGKKVTVALFDETRRVAFADRFGDVYRWSPETITALDSLPSKVEEPVLLFSHLAIVTAMAFAGSGNFLVSGDNHEKIRVTSYPEGAEIYSFCLGHTQHITALLPQGPGRLLSAAADGTLRLWGLDGESLGSCDLGAPISSLASSGSSLTCSCEEPSGGLRSVKISEDFLLSATKVDTTEAPQAACIGAGDKLCWVDRRGHLRTQTAEGSWNDVFVGDDLPVCTVNLSKNANLWETMNQDDAAAEADDDQGESAKRGQKRSRDSQKQS